MGASRRGFTRGFEDQVVWLACQASKSAITQVMRVAWRTVGAIIARVVAERGADHDPLAGLVRIGIDEISHRKGQRYLTVVVDHDTGRLVWARPGRDEATVEAFFDDLGDDRAAALRLISTDAGSWITNVVDRRARNAIRCMDPFHVVAVRREAPFVRVGCKDPPPVCRSRPVKLEAA